jgi:hypothetical protein
VALGGGIKMNTFLFQGYQILKNGKLYGSTVPPDVQSLRIKDVELGEKISLQLVALTEHPVGRQGRDGLMSQDGDSGIDGSSHPDDRTHTGLYFLCFMNIYFNSSISAMNLSVQRRDCLA